MDRKDRRSTVASAGHACHFGKALGVRGTREQSVLAFVLGVSGAVKEATGRE